MRLATRLRAIATVLGLGRHGIYIPHRHADALAGAQPPYAWIARRMRAVEATFRQHLAAIDGYGEALLAIGGAPPPQPRWTQDWFPRLDAAAAYAMVRRAAPKRLIEVGAGHSTRFYARAVADGSLGTRILAVDPQPRADLAQLPLSLDRRTLQVAGLEPFRALRLGDVLSIDSSHLLLPGSDVDLLLNRVLPELPAGVLVQIHDILLPDDYPPAWAWRRYNEQQGVAALLAGQGWDIEWSSRWVATRMTDAVAASVVGRLPLLDGAVEASLWLRKTATSR